MVSRIEDVLLRDCMYKGQIRSKLFSYLNDGTSLYRLRILSKRMKKIVDDRPMGLFRQLYIRLPFPKPQVIMSCSPALTSKEPVNDMDGAISYKIPHNLPSLWSLAPLCTSLTIKVMYGEKQSPYELGDAMDHLRMVKEAAANRHASMNSLQRGMWKLRNPPYEEPVDSMAVSIRKQETMPEGEWNLDLYTWENIWRSFTSLVQLTISVNGDPSWPGCTKVEHLLTMLRISLERGQPPRLRTICLHPIHAAGIIHLRWTGFAALVETPFRPQPVSGIGSRHNAEVWTKLMTVDLRLRNPAASKTVTANQMMTTLKVLEDYLRSFSRRLRCFRFVWLDAPGPNPLALHEQEGLRDRRPLIWPRLAELWLGNITQIDSTLALLPSLAPNVTIYKVLEDTYCSVRNIPLSPSVWTTVYGDVKASHKGVHPAIASLNSDSVSNQTATGQDTLFSRRQARSVALNKGNFTQTSAVPLPLSIPITSVRKAMKERKHEAHPAFRPTAGTLYSKNERLSTGDPDLLRQRPPEDSETVYGGSGPTSDELDRINEELTAEIMSLMEVKDPTSPLPPLAPTARPRLPMAGRKYTAFNNALTVYSMQGDDWAEDPHAKAETPMSLLNPATSAKHIPLASAVTEYERKWAEVQAPAKKARRGREPPPVPAVISTTIEYDDFDEDEYLRSGIVPTWAGPQGPRNSRTGYHVSIHGGPQVSEPIGARTIASSVYSRDVDDAGPRESVVTAASSVVSRPLSKFFAALRRHGRPPKRQV